MWIDAYFTNPNYPKYQFFINYTGTQNNYLSIPLMENDIVIPVSHEEVIEGCAAQQYTRDVLGSD